ncbi:MAG: PglZ domain-containing protein [Muribaculaceae bacterium]|nr:PglZ domain-containing protein [Muribaculaceae bacterium]
MAIIDNIYNYFARNENLHILFVFDPLLALKAELDSVEWQEGYRFVEFKGIWFATKYALENEWKQDKVVLHFQMQAPENHEARLNFPLMDLLIANAEYKSENHESFMQIHRIDNSHREFVRRHIAELQLEKFNRILKDYYGDAFSADLGYRGLISGYMGDSKLLPWNEIILRLFIFAHNNEEAKSIKFFVALQQHSDVMNALQNKLQGIFGAAYDPNSPKKIEEIARRFKYNLITQLLGVEHADNYKHLKITNAVLLEQMNQLHQSVATITPKRQEEWQEAFDALAADVKESEIIRVYSLNAQYFYVPVTMCWEILNTIIADQLQAESEEALDRLRAIMLKHHDNDDIQSVVKFAMEVASFYFKCRSLGSLILNTPDEYVKKYTTDYYLLDTYYRKSIEYHLALGADIPVMSAIDDVKAQLDKDYARITNDINIEWVKCLQERGNGFGEISVAFRQENFYNTKKQSTKWVVIVCDALRYEMAQELTEELNRTRHNATLEPAISMLPSETKYCKPALFPYEQMDLFGDTLGIDNTNLDTIDKRTQHLQRYVEGAKCIKFEDVQRANKEEYRRIFASQLVYVYHNAIDEVSHGGSRGSVVATCRDSVKEIVKVVANIHNHCSTSNIIITSDHGFLYNDMVFAENDKTAITEDNIEQKTRYYITNSNAPMVNVAKFPLKNVSGINSDVMVAVPVGTNRFKVQGADYNFVHGGASLQEVIIPVVHSSLKRTDVKRKVDITLLTRNLSIVSSRLKVQLFQNDAVSAEIKARDIIVAIYCNDEKVTNDMVLSIDSTDAEVMQNRLYDINLTLNQNVSSGILQFRVYDKEDLLNPLIKETVTNNTLIEQDF